MKVKVSGTWSGVGNIFIKSYGNIPTHSFTRFANPWSYHFYTAFPDYEYITENQYSSEQANYFSVFTESISIIPNTVPIYRLFQRSGYPNEDPDAIVNIHLYTINVDEYNSLLTIPGWEFEGIVGYAFPSSISNTIPIYRSYNSTTGDFLFSTSYAEATNSSGYTYQGIAFYVPDMNSGVWVGSHWRKTKTAWIKQNGSWVRVF